MNLLIKRNSVSWFEIKEAFKCTVSPLASTYVILESLIRSQLVINVVVTLVEVAERKEAYTFSSFPPAL